MHTAGSSISSDVCAQEDQPEEGIARRLALLVEYDGSEYAGFQLQKDQPSIQGKIEAALNSFTGESIRIRGASRTDAGAHARGQVVDFLTTSRHHARVFPRALNYYLPKEIQVQCAYQVPYTFHSRKHASGRTYRYNVLNRAWASPLAGKHSFWVRGDLNVERMASAAQSLVGKHDFRPFAPGFPSEKSSHRHVSRWEVWREDDSVIFECEANGFIKHQIRRTNGLLLQVGKGRWPASVVADVIGGKCEQDVEWSSIPAHGLCLMKVTYPDYISVDMTPKSGQEEEDQLGLGDNLYEEN